MYLLKRFSNLFFVLLMLSLACGKSDEKPDPTIPTGIATTEKTSVGGNTATVGGTVATNGGATIISFGVCYSKTNIIPTISDQVSVASGDPLQPFALTLTALDQNTQYYYAAFATNEKGTAYGTPLTFTTTALAVPQLTTADILPTDIADTSALVAGNVTDDFGLSVTERGICWKSATSSGDPTTSDSKKAMGTGTGSFSGMILGLIPVTTYKVRAYAITGNGTGYGNTVVFETKPGLPKVVTQPAIKIGRDSATVPFAITSANGALITRIGVCVSLNANPGDTTDGPLVAKGNGGGGVGTSSGRFLGLTPATIYHARAFAVNAAGIRFGNDITFTTLP